MMLQKFNREKYFFTESNRFKWSLAFIVSAFTIILLIVFQPFGINNYHHESHIDPSWLWYIFTIGLVAFIAIIFNEFLIRSLLKIKPTFFHLSLWFLWEFVWVGSVLFVYYNFLGGFHDFTFQAWLVFLVNTLFVLVLPYLGTLFVFNYRALKKEFSKTLTLSKEKSSQNDILFISGDYKKDEIALSPGRIIVIKAEDNYAALHYLEEENVKVHLIRSSLSSMEKVFEQAFFLRCNRSFIVNLDRIDFFQKQGNKLIIKLQQYPDEILVTKKYLPKVNQYLDQHYKKN